MAAITELKPAKSVREVRRFLGLANSYRRFIDNCSSLTAPISDLTTRTKTFAWTNDAQMAFEKLKACLTSPRC